MPVAAPPKDYMIVVWFSCGAASAVAAKKTIEKYGDDAVIRVVNSPVKEEHPDNFRFLHDVEKWLGVDIEFAFNPKYLSCSCKDVWSDAQYMSGVNGAPCTRELKKTPRQLWEDVNKPDYHVLGFTADEKRRHDNFYMFERANIIPVLIDAGLTKLDCLRIIMEANIRPPEIYALGYPNANCIGRVKASSPTYWNHVRKTHPDVFWDMCERSRKIGCRLVVVEGERIFLDELASNVIGAPMKSMDVECGIFCEERV